MRERIKAIERGREWTVIDLELGYRICNHNQEFKGPAPSHIHDRFDQVVASCSARTASQAFHAMCAYRRDHDSLDVHVLEAEVKRWK